MKNQLFLFITILFLNIGCDNSFENSIVGNWNKCNRSGSYVEFEITEKKLIILNFESDEILVFKNQLNGNKMIISEFKNGINLMINPDTIYVKFLNQNKILLDSRFTIDNVEMKRTQVTLDKIDSTNIGLWKNKTLKKFHKRADNTGCKDLRTDDEKEVPILNFEHLEEEVEIIEYENDER